MCGHEYVCLYEASVQQQECGKGIMLCWRANILQVEMLCYLTECGEPYLILLAPLALIYKSKRGPTLHSALSWRLERCHNSQTRYGASQCGSLNNIFLKAGRLFSILVYIRRVTTTRRDGTKSTNHLPNTITMVVEPLAPPAAWIWWTHAARGVGGLAHARSDAPVEAI